MGVGFLHGVLPQGISRDSIIRPAKVRILTTDELLLPKELRSLIENELHVKLEVTLTRDWNALLAKTVATPSEDILLLPSYWAATLRQQNLLSNMASKDSELARRVAADFIETNPNKELFDFLPIYWIKTGFLSFNNQSLGAFFKTSSEKPKKDDSTKNVMFLLADEDLILRHFQIWKEQGLSSNLSQKKILTLPLEEITKTDRDGFVETALNELHPDLQMDHQLSALLIWGAVIPVNSDKKNLAAEILNILTTPLLQEQVLTQTPFNSTLSQVTAETIPPQRRASAIRNLQLKDTLILDHKDIEARSKLKTEFGFSL